MLPILTYLLPGLVKGSVSSSGSPLRLIGLLLSVLAIDRSVYFAYVCVDTFEKLYLFSPLLGYDSVLVEPGRLHISK